MVIKSGTLKTIERSVFTMKRIVSVLFCLALLAACAPAFANADGAYFQSTAQIPDAVLEFFSDPSFTGYTIGWYGYAETARMVNGAWHGYAFAVAQKDGHNVLYGFRSSGGQAFRHFLTTDSAIPQGPGRFELANIDGYTIETYPSASSADADSRFTLSDAAIAIRFQVADNEEYFNWSMWADCDPSGQWHVRWLHANAFGTKYSEARLTEEGVTTYFELAPQGTAKGVVETNLRYFSWEAFPKSLQEAREKLTNPPAIPSGELNAQRVRFTGGQKYEVYSGPGAQYLRANNGRASVSTNDWIQVFGSENGYILIQYDLSSAQNRFGYIPQSALPGGTHVSPLAFVYTDASIITSTALTDDPLRSQTALCTLNSGDAVTWLAVMGNWVYVEANVSGQSVRGFVPVSAVSRSIRKSFSASFQNQVYSAQATVEMTYENILAANIAIIVNGPSAWKSGSADRVIGYKLYANNLLIDEVTHAVGYINQSETFAFSSVIPNGTVVLGLCPVYASGPAIGETITVALAN